MQIKFKNRRAEYIARFFLYAILVVPFVSSYNDQQLIDIILGHGRIQTGIKTVMVLVILYILFSEIKLIAKRN
jgi:hypothetical protein